MHLAVALHLLGEMASSPSTFGRMRASGSMAFRLPFLRVGVALALGDCHFGSEKLELMLFQSEELRENSAG